LLRFGNLNQDPSRIVCGVTPQFRDNSIRKHGTRRLSEIVIDKRCDAIATDPFQELTPINRCRRARVDFSFVSWPARTGDYQR
jgi:hypothetical protein